MLLQGMIEMCAMCGCVGICVGVGVWVSVWVCRHLCGCLCGCGCGCEGVSACVCEYASSTVSV